MNKTATIKLTAAIGIAGQLVPRGEIITVPESAAKDLLRRGKAELATEADDPDYDEADAAAAAQAEREAEEAAAAQAEAEAKQKAEADAAAAAQAAAATTAKPSGKKK